MSDCCVSGFTRRKKRLSAVAVFVGRASRNSLEHRGEQPFGGESQQCGYLAYGSVVRHEHLLGQRHAAQLYVLADGFSRLVFQHVVQVSSRHAELWSHCSGCGYALCGRRPRLETAVYYAVERFYRVYVCIVACYELAVVEPAAVGQQEVDYAAYYGLAVFVDTAA